MTHKQTKQICGSWNPIVSNVILNEDNTLTDAGTVHIDGAKWIQSHDENIIHFEVDFSYTPPRGVSVKSVSFVLTFPTEFRYVGSVYGWVDFCRGDLIALNPDALFSKARVSIFRVSANVKTSVIRGVFILR